jgi:hypothetical protein
VFQLSVYEMRGLTVRVYMIRAPNLYLLSVSVVPKVIETTDTGDVVKFPTRLSDEFKYVIDLVL